MVFVIKIEDNAELQSIGDNDCKPAYLIFGFDRNVEYWINARCKMTVGMHAVDDDIESIAWHCPWEIDTIILNSDARFMSKHLEEMGFDLVSFKVVDRQPGEQTYYVVSLFLNTMKDGRFMFAGTLMRETFKGAPEFPFGTQIIEQWEDEA